MGKELIFFDIVLEHTECPQQHRHDLHEFFFNYEPGGEQLVGDRRVAMEPDQLYFFPAGQMHIGNGHCHGGVIYVGTELFETYSPGSQEAAAVLKLLGGRALDGYNLIPLKNENRRQVQEIFRQMLAEFRQNVPGMILAWRILTMQLLLIIMRMLKSSQINQMALKQFSSEERIGHACIFIRENYHRKLSVESAARAAGMSRSHFLAMFHKVTGTTFTEYLNQLRCEKAIALLRQGTGTEEAAIRCGFSSVSNFYRAFRQITGDSPGSFKNSDYIL